jgi:hypothetical protein
MRILDPSLSPAVEASETEGTRSKACIFLVVEFDHGLLIVRRVMR